MRRGLATIAITALLLCQSGVGSHAQTATTQRIVVDRHTGLAIDGFDPVAYFTERDAREGVADHEAGVGGAIWRFSSAANRAAFIDHPEIYAPQFGGYDPIGVARGVPLPGNALNWLISGQRLYLFSRESDREAFAADPQRYLDQARQQWPGLIATLAE